MRRLLLTLLILPTLLRADPLTLSGYLDKGRLEAATKQLETLSEEKPKQLVITVSSTGGELDPTLKLVEKLSDLRKEGIEIVVYIQDNAVGPAAALPFIASIRYSSPHALWGDLGIDEVKAPKHLVRSRLLALIPEKERERLQPLAKGMVDADLAVMDSPVGEPLVLNEQQMEELGLIEGILTPAEFRKRFGGEEPEAAPSSPLEAALTEHIQYNPSGPNKVGHILIGKEQISKSTWIKVRSALSYYKKEKPAFVILELNTPGGEVFVSQEISDALKDLDTQYGIPVVALIDNWAISAGAMLAYSCRFIATTKDGLMGAALPIMVTQEGGVQAASEKIRSVVRADFASRASFYGRNPFIAEAMVDPDIILVDRGGEVIPLNNEDEIRSRTDTVISAKGKLLTLKSQEMLDLKVANMLLTTSPLPPTEEELAQGIWPLSKSPLFEVPFFAAIPDATVISYQTDWKETFFSILTLPIVSSLLVLGLILGFYMEINTPGFGFAGVVALVCLFFIILSSFALQAMNWFEVGLLALGLLLLALEIFVIPGFGIAGILGILFATVGLVAMLLPNIKKIDWDFEVGAFNPAGEEFLIRLAWIGGAIIVGVIAMFFLSRYVLPKIPRLGHLVLKGEQEASKGYVAGLSVEKLPPPGTVGEALTPLRPSGKVTIGGEIFDATTTGSYIGKGKEITVIDRQATHLVVEEKC